MLDETFRNLFRAFYILTSKIYFLGGSLLSVKFAQNFVCIVVCANTGTLDKTLFVLKQRLIQFYSKIFNVLLSFCLLSLESSTCFLCVHFGKTCKMVPQVGVSIREVLSFREHYKNSYKNNLAGHWDTCST